MVILAYFGPMGKLKFQFSLSVSIQFDFYTITNVGNMLKALKNQERLVIKV